MTAKRLALPSWLPALVEATLQEAPSYIKAHVQDCTASTTCMPPVLTRRLSASLSLQVREGTCARTDCAQLMLIVTVHLEKVWHHVPHAARSCPPLEGMLSVCSALLAPPLSHLVLGACQRCARDATKERSCPCKQMMQHDL